MNNTSPLISCLMITANRPEHMARAILCYQQQLWPNKELIVVDTGDHDIIPLTEDIPESELQHIKVDPDANHTMASLNNLAMSQAKGTYLAHWGASDWHHPKRLGMQFEAMEDHIDISWLSGTLLHLDHPEYVHHPYTDLPSDGYKGSFMHRKNNEIRYPENKRNSEKAFLAAWNEQSRKMLDPDLSWLVIRGLAGDSKSRAHKNFLAGYRNNSKDLARLAWVKLRGKTMVSHPRFKLSREAKESFRRYLRESRDLGLITSVS